VAGATVTGWVQPPANASQVISGTLTFTGDLAAGSAVCLQVRNSANFILGNGCQTLGAVLGSGNPVTVDFDANPDATPSAAAITRVDVTVIQPVATPANVTVDGWTLHSDDIRLVSATILKFDDSLAAGSWVCAQVRDSADAILDSGCTFFSAGLATGLPAPVPFASNPGAAPIVRIDVSVSPSADPPVCAGFLATIVGTEGKDEVEGTSGPDVIVTFGGGDKIEGKGGDDIICSGAGDDEVNGNGGHDYIDAGPGKDNLEGNAGNDTLDGGPGKDKCRGGSGANTLINCEGSGSDDD
jgi:Ca2+-binding RTX toxin-like protein